MSLLHNPANTQQYSCQIVFSAASNTKNLLLHCLRLWLDPVDATYAKDFACKKILSLICGQNLFFLLHRQIRQLKSYKINMLTYKMHPKPHQPENKLYNS